MFPASNQYRSRLRGCPAPEDDNNSAARIRVPGRPGARGARHALGLMLLLALPGGAQYGPTPPRQQGTGLQAGSLLRGTGDTDPIEEEKRLRELNALRQRQLVSDTNKLLKLAHELNDSVNAAKPEELKSTEFVKVAEIEKLAHSVKDKMSTSVRGTTAYDPFLFRQGR